MAASLPSTYHERRFRRWLCRRRKRAACAGRGARIVATALFPQRLLVDGFARTGELHHALPRVAAVRTIQRLRRRRAFDFDDLQGATLGTGRMLQSRRVERHWPAKRAIRRMGCVRFRNSGIDGRAPYQTAAARWATPPGTFRTRDKRRLRFDKAMKSRHFRRWGKEPSGCEGLARSK
jgi:hypothetical protein